ncbi:MAG: hypothetical protein JWP89_6592 [Schlesneria sp.]|nr:hypothetical protein [Schlesneria sp.]
MSRANRTISCLLAVWLLTTTVGCATINLSKIDFRSRKASARNPAIKIVCLWEPAEGRDPKGMPCQGFAGQILFLTGKSLPVSVEGDVKVYLFDDHGTSEEQGKPLHEFNFDSEAWAQHYSYGSLGPCYNVFIPYMRKGASDATCALRLRLTPPENQGPALFSEMTSIELFGYGDAKKGPVKSSTSDSRVEQTTPEDLTSVNNRRRTTTIVLNAKDGVPGNATENPKVSPKSAIQQASYEVDEVKPLTEADARMAQLEQMVQQLQALQQTQQVPAAKPARATLPAPPPRLLEEVPAQQPSENRTRIKMRSMESVDDDEAGSAKLQQLEDDSDDERTISRKPATTERRSHPLADDAPVAPRTSPRTSAVRRQSDMTLDEIPKKRKVQSHPLDDDYDQVQPVVHRKVIRAVELGPKAEQKRRTADEAFEPIETNRAEAAADESPPVRVRLRAVN